MPELIAKGATRRTPPGSMLPRSLGCVRLVALISPEVGPQNPVGATSCRFKSDLRHPAPIANSGRDSCRSASYDTHSRVRQFATYAVSLAPTWRRYRLSTMLFCRRSPTSWGR